MRLSNHLFTCASYIKLEVLASTFFRNSHRIHSTMSQAKATIFIPDDRFYKGIPALEEAIHNRVNVVNCSDIENNPDLAAKLRVACWNGHFSSPIKDYLAAGKLPNLELVVMNGVGYNHMPFDLLKQKGVRVTNTPGVLADATAEMAMTLMLASARQLVKGE